MAQKQIKEVHFLKILFLNVLLCLYIGYERKVNNSQYW